MSPDSMGAIAITKIQESLQSKKNMSRLNIHEYLARHQAEFPNSKIHHELPMPTNSISVVSDPENWHCYPQNVVRIYLTNYDENHLIGIGDFKHPTICTKLFSSLDDACSFIANHPSEISREWLDQNGFDFLDTPVSKPYRI
ncbi:hypothetical protein [Nostoc flagelliforme]|uniref:hypothetical protein n=1 Tax=Nostoc flagelliforme TaxID=1306274 RepID=UPI001688A9DA|nr:hypothetical protein [Nostoc flagelliforme]